MWEQDTNLWAPERITCGHLPALKILPCGSQIVSFHSQICKTSFSLLLNLPQCGIVTPLPWIIQNEAQVVSLLQGISTLAPQIKYPMVPTLIPGVFFYDYRFWLLHLRVCLYVGIDRYKNPIRIRIVVTYGSLRPSLDCVQTILT